MELAARDYEVLKLVDTFNQLASTHIAELLFADRSHSVPDKVLGRLVAHGFLSRVGRRASGDNGGAGAYVYQLGRNGRALLGTTGRRTTTVNNHALMVADIYGALRRTERVGGLVLKEWAAEHPVPPGNRADLFVSVEYPAQHRHSSYYLEADLGTERPARITEKIAGYWRAVEMSTADYFPYVVLVARHQARKAELARVIRGLDEEHQEMVCVCLLDELIPRLSEL